MWLEGAKPVGKDMLVSSSAWSDDGTKKDGRERRRGV